MTGVDAAEATSFEEGVKRTMMRLGLTHGGVEASGGGAGCRGGVEARRATLIGASVVAVVVASVGRGFLATDGVVASVAAYMRF